MTSKQPPNGDGRLDALLRSWPALDGEGGALPPEGDMAWDERADAIVAAARAGATDKSAVERALATPNLPAEPGEPRFSSDHETGPRARPADRAFRSGELSMSDSEGSAGSKPPSSMPGSQAPSSMPRPRQSLREIAERASQSGRASVSGSAASTPLPGRASQPDKTDPPSTQRPSVSAASTPVPSPSVKRPIEAGSADSGVVDLNIINAAADSSARAAAAKAKPAEASLFDDDAPASSKAAAGAAPAAKGSDKGKPKPKVAVAAAAAAPAKRSGGPVIGIVIALVGVAAAFAIWQVRKGGGAAAVAHDEAPTPAVTAESKPATPAEAKANAVAEAPTAAGDQGLDPSALPDEQRAAAAAARGGRVPGPLPKTVESAAPSAVAVAEPPKKGSAVGSLNEEMQKATGTDGKAKGGDGEPEFAGGAERSKTLPERPSQGAVQAAIGAVLGGAKACVSEADEPTTATVTFKSSGEVSGVTVRGWASANGKSGCVVSALKGAKVGAFTDGSYSFPVTIRP